MGEWPLSDRLLLYKRLTHFWLALGTVSVLTCLSLFFVNPVITYVGAPCSFLISRLIHSMFHELYIREAYTALIDSEIVRATSLDGALAKGIGNKNITVLSIPIANVGGVKHIVNILRANMQACLDVEPGDPPSGKLGLRSGNTIFSIGSQTYAVKRNGVTISFRIDVSIRSKVWFPGWECKDAPNYDGELVMYFCDRQSGTNIANAFAFEIKAE